MWRLSEGPHPSLVEYNVHDNIVVNAPIRWEARKDEGARALAMIRRQVVARGQQSRQQRRCISSADVVTAPAVAGSSSLSEESPAVETARRTTRAAVTTRAADAQALCPAAVVITRAVEAVLSGRTATFGRAPAAGEANAALVEGEPAVVVGGEKKEAFEAEGGEGSQAERERYREILEGLSRAKGALHRALETTTEYPCAPTAPAAVDDTTAADGSSTAQTGGDGGGVCQATAGSVTEERETSAILSPQEGNLPPVSLWRFRCSSGGTAAGEGKDVDVQQGGEGEEKGVNEVRSTS